MKKEIKNKRPDWLINAPPGYTFTGLARIINKKDFGKILFLEAHFNVDTIQLILEQKYLPNIDELRSIHPGSCIRFSGNKCITRNGEHSINVTEAKLEVSCYKTLPDKYRGLQQTHRYENRMLDLMVNSGTFKFFKITSDVTYRIREFLYKRNFREFNTSILQEFFEAGLAQPFVTTCNANRKQYNLGLTSEIKLKRLIIAGYERVFEILQSFRNGGISQIYSPEFTLLEIYQQTTDYKDMMLLVEEMITYAIIDTFPDLHPIVGHGKDEHKIDFTTPYRQISFLEACESLLDLPEKNCNLETLIKKFPKSFTNGMHQSTWISKLISKYISPYFSSPTFLTETPFGLSPLVKMNSANRTLSDYAVLLISGMTIANMYTDENDPKIVRKEMIRQSQYTGKAINESFLELLEYGLPQTAGIGLSLNRLFLMLRGQLPNNIKETILYPIK
ncbi:MAG: hypothetical protein HY219_00235 [Candidatus Staskawiczbacteria bacterium]|nr:hypothetical protein [Candidatus Staskawiczbacteria bacterium]